MEIRDYIGVVIGSIFSILFAILSFDIRAIRQNKPGFLKEEKHQLLCDNSMLRVERKIDDMKDEVLKAIRENNK